MIIAIKILSRNSEKYRLKIIIFFSIISIKRQDSQVDSGADHCAERQ